MGRASSYTAKSAFGWAHGARAMPAIASSVFRGVTPLGGVDALKNWARQSSFATVNEAAMSEPSVLSVASDVVWVLLIGFRITLPQPAVAGSIRFGTFPAAIRSPSGLPEIDYALMKRAAVNAEATEVSSLTVTVAGALAPSTVISTITGSSPPTLLAEPRTGSNPPRPCRGR